MIKEYFDKYKYYMAGSVLFLVVSFISGKYLIKKENTDEKIKETKIKSNKTENKNNNQELILISKMFKKEMDNSIQSLIKFAKNEIDRFENKKYTDFSKEAFQKDVIKKHILIDTITLDSKNKDTSNYIIKFGKKNYPEKFRNVIGFRLINSLIPSIYIRINENNNIIKLNIIDTNNNKIPKIIPIEEGAYTFETLGDSLQAHLNSIFLQLNINSSITVSSDINTYKYTIDNIPNNYKIQFLWELSNSAYRLFGANKTNDIIINSLENPTPYTFPYSADTSVHFVDLVVDEIPNIACKVNSRGRQVIDRIPIPYPTGTLSFYRPSESEVGTKNLFYPMDLSTLSIKLFDDHGYPYKNDNLDHSLEFEITILENESLV